MDPDEIARLDRNLDEFALPRALIDLKEQRFVAWNKTFLARTGYSEDELRALKPQHLIVQGDSAFVPAEAGTHPDVEFYPAALKTPKEEAAIPGHLVKSTSDFGYLMLEELNPNVSSTFAQGRLVGNEENRKWVAQVFHEELSSELLAAVFQIHLAKEKLEAIGSPGAEEVAQVSEILSETIQKISKTFGEQAGSRSDT
jgi:hypothetical protein